MRYISFGLVVALLALPSTADARVKKIVIEKKVSPALHARHCESCGLPLYWI